LGEAWLVVTSAATPFPGPSQVTQYHSVLLPLCHSAVPSPPAQGRFSNTQPKP
jgi:hypothetical protein